MRTIEVHPELSAVVRVIVLHLVGLIVALGGTQVVVDHLLPLPWWASLPVSWPAYHWADRIVGRVTQSGVS